MKKTAVFTALLTIVLAVRGVAQDNQIFPRGEKSPAVHHVGTVWLNELNKPDSIFNYSIAVATFDTSSRLYWHAHPGGQILLVTEGTGFYQERGRPKQVVHKGDVVKCQPGVEHWHGSTPGSGFGYLATTPAQKGKTIWLEPVSDREYFGGTAPAPNPEQEILNLSKKKWDWMADKNADSLATLFDEKSVFVHMGGSWGKQRELDIIRSGGIHYKHAEIQETSVQFVGATAIMLSKIRLTAVVGGNEVVNPFTVTEVYIWQGGSWVLGSLSFTKMLVPEGSAAPLGDGKH